MSEICEFYNVDPNKYRTCINLDWHHNGSYTCSYEGRKECPFWKRQIKGMEDCQILKEGPRIVIITTYEYYCHYDGVFCKHLSIEGGMNFCNYNDKQFIKSSKCPSWCPLCEVK